MNKLYKIKLRRENLGEKRVWGFDGHKGPLSWAEAVQLIADKGIRKVQYVQHLDKAPVNTKRLDGNEMLRLWQAVASAN